MQIYLLALLIITVFLLLLWIRKKKKTIEHLKLTKPCQYLCIYVYYQKDPSYRKNFKYFLRHGILPNVEYFIVVNGKCNVRIPRRHNITVLYRPNRGFDFGAYSYALTKVKREYDYYFFINTSSWFTNC